MKVWIALALSVALAAPAIAAEETEASKEESEKVKAAIAQIGCEASEVEKETSGVFEIDDAKCKIGQYDIKLDKDFTIISITRD
jgi:hypothetical protein